MVEEDFNKLVEEANTVYKENFSAHTWFGRCIFLSWYCDLGTCDFCFRSTIKHKIKHASTAKRTLSSVLTDAILGKNLGWRIEFLTGGYGIFSFEELLDLIKLVSKVYSSKIWVNLGSFDENQLDKISPYVEGICASIETVEKTLHDKVCPDKPIEPYSDMLKLARAKGFKTSMTMIVGLGEKRSDFEVFSKFIEEHKINRITFYALKPVRGTHYTESPSTEDYAWWVAKTRIKFPTLEIITGLTPKKPEYAGLILRAGSNAITKFPVVKRFGSADSKSIEQQIKDEGRELSGSLTVMPPDVDWDAEVDRLELDEKLAEDTKRKLKEYIAGMIKEKQ